MNENLTFSIKGVTLSYSLFLVHWYLNFKQNFLNFKKFRQHFALSLDYTKQKW